ncbi:histone acetyltransferase [Ciborinia camelliae]|nr:histone acetyltransferase [Ciborinia camelliae]
MPKRSAVNDSPSVITGDVEFRPVRNDGREASFVTLAKFQQVVQEQLPNMGAEYIAKTVLDPTHTTLVMVQKIRGPTRSKKLEEVIGGITYRVWEERKFVEMVYLVVATDHHESGHGTRLVNHFKDEIKSSYAEKVMEILTYADLTAVGFFKKQGYTKDLTLDKSVWGGIIKDYTKSTLMQCTLLPRIRYVEAARMLRKHKDAVLAKVTAVNKRNDVVHALARETGPRPHSTSLRDFLSHLRRTKRAWPFLKPVTKDIAPDYHKVITHPMDLQTMGEKLDKGLYKTPKAFVDDVKLIISNCREYNEPGTLYHRYSNVLESAMLAFIKDMPEWSKPVNILE